MTDEFTARASMVDLISQAVHTLAYLYAHSRVTITNLWTDTGSGPGVTAHENMIVRADVTGLPDERGALLAGLAPITEPDDWAGEHGTYREWTGALLTMRVVVSMRLDLDEPPRVAEPAPVVVTDPVCLGAPANFTAACGWPGPHGEHPVGSRAPMDEPLPAADPDPLLGPAHRAAHAAAWTRGIRAGRTAAKYAEPAAAPAAVVDEPEPDHRPLLGLLVDERYGDLKSHVIEVYGEPGQSADDLAAGYRDLPGVVVVPARDPEPDGLRESWRRYAVARTIHYFETVRHGERFPSLADALTAVNLWPGRDMLEQDWAIDAAQQLVDPSAAEADRDPATAGAARGRLRRLIPTALRGRGGEVVIR